MTRFMASPRGSTHTHPKSSSSYLIDTNIISEIRKGKRTNNGVRAFFRQAEADASALYLSVVTVFELRRNDLARLCGARRGWPGDAMRRHIASKELDATACTA